MKFKTIFIIFNIVIVLSFLFIFFMPLIVLGWDYSKAFWEKNWLLALLFVLVIAGLNTYFGLNWQLFSLLEREDWARVSEYLEKKVLTEGKVRKNFLRILVNSYLVTSNIDGISRLENFLKEKHPRLVSEFAVELGIPHLIKNDPIDLQEYYGQFIAMERFKEKGWISWNYAFSLMLQKKHEEARVMLQGLAQNNREPILLALSLYLLDAFAKSDDNMRLFVNEKKDAIRKRYTVSAWNKVLEKSNSNLQVVVLSKLIQDATLWLFAKEADRT